MYNPSFLFAKNECEAYIISAAKIYHVPIPILYAVGMTETGRKNSLQPYALNIDGKTYFMPSKAQAIAKIYSAERDRANFIDIGCMQINKQFHGQNFKSLGDMLDPQQNVNYAAKFLSNLYKRYHKWTTAVAFYHASAAKKNEQKWYVCQVIKNLISTGFGQITQKAKNMCKF